MNERCLQIRAGPLPLMASRFEEPRMGKCSPGLLRPVNLRPVRTSEQHYGYWQRETHVGSRAPETLRCSGENSVHQDAPTARLHLIFLLDLGCACVSVLFFKFPGHTLCVRQGHARHKHFPSEELRV